MNTHGKPKYVGTVCNFKDEYIILLGKDLAVWFSLEKTFRGDFEVIQGVEWTNDDRDGILEWLKYEYKWE